MPDLKLISLSEPDAAIRFPRCTSPLKRDALTVVTSPEMTRTKPGLRTLAWASLMSQRGCRVDQIRIRQMQDALEESRGAA